MNVPVIAPGARVKFVEAPDVEAVVLQVALTGWRSSVRVQYEVAFWSGKTRSTCWADAFEISTEVDERIRVGFVNERGAGS